MSLGFFGAEQCDIRLTCFALSQNFALRFLPWANLTVASEMAHLSVCLNTITQCVGSGLLCSAVAWISLISCWKWQLHPADFEAEWDDGVRLGSHFRLGLNCCVVFPLERCRRRCKSRLRRCPRGLASPLDWWANPNPGRCNCAGVSHSAAWDASLATADAWLSKRFVSKP